MTTLGSGSSPTSRTRPPASLKATSPTTLRPSWRRAARRTAWGVAGRTWPRRFRMALAWRTASAKSPLASYRVTRKRLPKVWPENSPRWKR